MCPILVLTDLTDGGEGHVAVAGLVQQFVVTEGAHVEHTAELVLIKVVRLVGRPHCEGTCWGKLK